MGGKTALYSDLYVFYRIAITQGMVLGLWLQPGKTCHLRSTCQNLEWSYVIIRHFCILLATSMLSFKVDVYIQALIGANKSKAYLSNNRNPVITSRWVLGEECVSAAIAQLGRDKQRERKTWPITAYLWMWLYQERGCFCSLSHRNTPASLPIVKELSAPW